MMIKNYLIIFLTAIILIFSSGYPVNAQTSSGSKGIGCGEGFGVIAEFLCGLTRGNSSQAQSNTKVVANKLNTVISGIIGVLTVIGGLWFLIQFIIGGFNWISSGGDKGKLQQAQDKLNNAVIGLLIVVAAWVIVGVVGKIIGLDILNPGLILNSIKL